MAAAEILRLTHIINNQVTTVINGTSGVLADPGSQPEPVYV